MFFLKRFGLYLLYTMVTPHGECAFVVFPTTQRRKFPLCSEVFQSKLYPLPIFSVTKTFPWMKYVKKWVKNVYNPLSIQFHVSFTTFLSYAFFPPRLVPQRPAPPAMLHAWGTGWSFTLLLKGQKSSKATCSLLFPKEFLRTTEPQTAEHLSSQTGGRKQF